MMKTKSTIFTFLIVLSFTISFAQPGILDGDFDANGKVNTDITNFNDSGMSVAVQADGKIIVSGYAGLGTGDGNFGTVRYNIDGSLDNSFSVDGIVTTDFTGTDDVAHAVVVQADGKVIVAGNTRRMDGHNSIALVRYNTDGTLDNDFNTDGRVITNLPNSYTAEGNSVVLQPDGKIIVAGSFWENFDDKQFATLRYNVDGTLDNSFGTDGVVLTTVNSPSSTASSIAIQSDGKIVVAGRSYNSEDFNADFAVVRYNPDGSLDNSFSVDGKLTTAIGTGDDYAKFVMIQPDGKIVAFGRAYNESSTDYHFAVVRYNTDGTLDNSFSLDGKVITNFGQAYGMDAFLQPDGKIVAVGYPDFRVVRFNTDGTLDTSFGDEGIVISEMGDNSFAKCCAMQPDGKIIVAGSSDVLSHTAFTVARYISGLNLGIISFSKQEHGLLIYPNPILESAVIEYTLTNEETISIDLYDISGRLVQSFIKSEKRIKGIHKERLVFDASIPSGTYLLTLNNGVGSTSVQVVK